MYRHSHTVFLQKQGAWPFWKIWTFLDKDLPWNAIEHLSGVQLVLCQFIVSMLRYTNIAAMYQLAYFLNERAQVPSSISAGVSLTRYSQVFGYHFNCNDMPNFVSGK
jgi:hypothetical protein